MSDYYVRTKNNKIIECNERNLQWCLFNNGGEYNKDVEKLCDMFVMVDGIDVEFYDYGDGAFINITDHYYCYSKELMADIIKRNSIKFYGAIITDKGLVYVIEMGEDGNYRCLE